MFKKSIFKNVSDFLSGFWIYFYSNSNNCFCVMYYRSKSIICNKFFL